jgi:hypothetical protein
LRRRGERREDRSCRTRTPRAGSGGTRSTLQVVVRDRNSTRLRRSMYADTAGRGVVHNAACRQHGRSSGRPGSPPHWGDETFSRKGWRSGCAGQARGTSSRGSVFVLASSAPVVTLPLLGLAITAWRRVAQAPTREGDPMNTCPTCGSTKTVVDVASRRVLCIKCGTRWIKRPWRGAGVRVLDPAPPVDQRTKGQSGVSAQPRTTGRHVRPAHVVRVGRPSLAMLPTAPSDESSTHEGRGNE